MATTTNYSWATPDDTDLVKDGAAAIRTLGSSIDTTVFTNAGAAVAKSLVDAKGDIIAATADNTVDRLAVGANDTVLTADSSTATGLKWAASTGGLNWEAFTPTYVNFTLGNGTVVARKATSNDFEAIIIIITFGSTSSVSGALFIDAPTVGSIDYEFIPFTSFMYDLSAGLSYSGIGATGSSGGNIRLAPGAGGAGGTYLTRNLVTSTVPFTWATGDVLSISAFYEF
jgi:hypothetical protein